MSDFYYNRDGQPCSREVGLNYFMNDDLRRIGDDTIGDSRVSTVFLVIDHGFGDVPKLFETMIFGGKSSEYQERYSTEAEAVAGHKRIVDLLKAGSDLE